MSLMQFLRTLWARRWVMAICAGSCALAGLIAVLVLPRTYTAESRVMVNVSTTDPVTGEQLSPNFARAYLPTQAELVNDYRVAGRVVDNLGWTQSPELREAYKASGETKLDFRRWLAQGVSGSTSAYPLENSNIIVISYSDGDPQTAAQMANAVRDAYIQESSALQRETAAKTAQAFEQQATDLRGKLQDAEAKKAAFERANDIILLDDGTDADTARLQSLAGSVDAPQVSTVGGGNPNAAAIAALDARIATELQTLGPNHPTIQDLRRQRAALVATNTAASAPRTVVSGPSISSQVAGARARVMAQRGKVEEGRRLFTDVKVLQDQYSKVSAQMNELRQLASSTQSGFSLLDSAIPPTRPSSPKIPQILIGSIALGLVLGLLVGLISELLHRRVRGYEDLESIGPPVLGVIQAKPLPALAAS